MAIQDSVITLKGDQAAVRKIEIMKDKDGNFKIAVYGDTKTSTGADVGLNVALADRPAANATLSAMWAAALPILRTGNGLES
jgi:hypothetical protein